MSKHTPGPWEYIAKLSASENHKGYFVRAQKTTRDGKWALAEVQPGDEDGIIGEANARLIAAAPDLLAVLKELEECAGYWSEYDVPIGIVERIRAAIAKAEAV